MTSVGDLSLPSCDGVIAPEFCSGLAVVSRFPILEVSRITPAVVDHYMYLPLLVLSHFNNVPTGGFHCLCPVGRLALGL